MINERIRAASILVRQLWIVSRPALSLLALILVAIASLYYMGQHTLREEVIPQGDFAADLLLESRIDIDPPLLVGHYSRFEFNHPGPLYFYVTHVLHKFMADRPISAAAHATSLIMNGISLVLATCLTLFIWRIPISFGASLATVLIIISLTGTGLVSVWMPYRMILPYLVLFLSSVLIVNGRFGFFPLACLYVGILVHSYMSMVIMAIPLLIGATLYYFHSKDWRVVNRDLIALIVGGFIGLIFMLPIIVDLFGSGQSNLAKIFAAAIESKRSAKFVDLVRETSGAIPSNIGIIHFVVLLLWCYLIGRSVQYKGEQFNHAENAKRWVTVQAMALVLLIGFFLYHKFAPGPIYRNVTLFFTAVPIALVSLCASAIFSDAIASTALKRRGLQAAVIFLALLSVLYIRPMGVDPNNGRAIRDMANKMISLHEREKASEIIAINYERHDQWPVVVGILFELHQQGVAACSTWQHMAFLYTPEKTCAPGVDATYLLTPAQTCKVGKDRCVLQREGIGLIVPQS